MRLLLEVNSYPPVLKGCEQYICGACIYNNRDKPKCDGKLAYDQFLKEWRERGNAKRT